MSGNPMVIVTARSFAGGDRDVRHELESAGVTVVDATPTHDLAALGPLLGTAVGWIAGTGTITDQHLAAAPHLKVIARYGVGVDAVDLTAAALRGVMVTNTPGANSGAVADHTIALLLAALRKIPAGDRGVRQGRWPANRARELGSLVVGIVGLGRIGRAVAARLSGFGPVLLGHDPWVADADARAVGVEPIGLAELAARCDVISLHLPGDRTLVTEEWLADVRPGLVLVNTARASLVDEPALAAALRTRIVETYAADSLSTEWAAADRSPLLDPDLLDQTIFTPHWAAHTVQAVDAMGVGAARNVLAVLRGEIPPDLVDSAVTTPRRS